mgnify:CR=1 FL=1
MDTTVRFKAPFEAYGNVTALEEAEVNVLPGLLGTPHIPKPGIALVVVDPGVDLVGPGVDLVGPGVFFVVLLLIGG